jgi:hypothetical protein
MRLQLASPRFDDFRARRGRKVSNRVPSSLQGRCPFLLFPPRIMMNVPPLCV